MGKITLNANLEKFIELETQSVKGKRMKRTAALRSGPPSSNPVQPSKSVGLHGLGVPSRMREVQPREYGEVGERGNVRRRAACVCSLWGKAE